jgi:hypothetical protein
MLHVWIMLRQLVTVACLFTGAVTSLYGVYWAVTGGGLAVSAGGFAVSVLGLAVAYTPLYLARLTALTAQTTEPPAAPKNDAL